MKKAKDRSWLPTTETEDWVTVPSEAEGSAGLVLSGSRNTGFAGYDSLETRSRVLNTVK